MSVQPLTVESILEMFRATNLEIQNISRLMQERDATYAREKEERDARFEREKQEAARLMQERAAEFRQEMKERDARLEKLGQETDRKFQKAAEQLERTQKEIGKLGNNVGAMIENMIGERIVEKFQALGFGVTHPVRRGNSFLNHKMGISGEFDLMLVDTDVIVIIEAKLKLGTSDVSHFLGKIDEYRRLINAVGFVKPPFTHLLPSTRFYGAVAGAVIDGDAMKFAHENGLFVIVQSGDAVDIVPTPEGFQVRQW